jgi:hypothetical protein
MDIKCRELLRNKNVVHGGTFLELLWHRSLQEVFLSWKCYFQSFHFFCADRRNETKKNCRLRGFVAEGELPEAENTLTRSFLPWTECVFWLLLRPPFQPNPWWRRLRIWTLRLAKIQQEYVDPLPLRVLSLWRERVSWAFHLSVSQLLMLYSKLLWVKLSHTLKHLPGK